MSLVYMYRKSLTAIAPNMTNEESDRMSRGNYQDLNRFVNREVSRITEPLKLDDWLLEILEDQAVSDGDDDDTSDDGNFRGGRGSKSSKPIRKRELIGALRAANIKLSAQYQRFYSRQAVKQLTQQIMDLREEILDDSKDSMTALNKVELPINLQSDYKIYALRDVIEQVDELPRIVASGGDLRDDYLDYNLKREELLKTVAKLKKLQKKTEIVGKYNKLIDTKLGDQENVKRNIPNGINEVSSEIEQLKENIEKLNNLDPTAKVKLRTIIQNANNVVNDDN